VRKCESSFGVRVLLLRTKEDWVALGERRVELHWISRGWSVTSAGQWLGPSHLWWGGATGTLIGGEKRSQRTLGHSSVMGV